MKKIAFILLILSQLQLWSQNDTIKRTDESQINTRFLETSTEESRVTNPKKATRLALIPVIGLGQIYNKKYWKLPIIYGLNALIVYRIINSNNQYVSYRNELYKRDISAAYPEINWSTTNSTFATETTSSIRTTKDILRKKRDRAIIMAGGLYVMTVVDALVDAHLSNFSIDKKKVAHFRPGLVPSNQTLALGVNFKLSF